MMLFSWGHRALYGLLNHCRRECLYWDRLSSHFRCHNTPSINSQTHAFYHLHSCLSCSNGESHKYDYSDVYKLSIMFCKTGNPQECHNQISIEEAYWASLVCCIRQFAHSYCEKWALEHRSRWELEHLQPELWRIFRLCQWIRSLMPVAIFLTSAAMCLVYQHPSLCFVSKQLECFERLAHSFKTATLSLLWLI